MILTPASSLKIKQLSQIKILICIRRVNIKRLNFTIIFFLLKKYFPTPFYKNSGMRIEDTDTEKEALRFVTEEFQLKDRNRAEVYRPNGYGAYGHYGY